MKREQGGRDDTENRKKNREIRGGGRKKDSVFAWHRKK